MKLRTLLGWAAIVVSTAMPLAAVNMVAAYVDNSIATATFVSRESELRRLSELNGDIRSLPAGTASALLARHDLFPLMASSTAWTWRVQTSVSHCLRNFFSNSPVRARTLMT
ncbi:hypothetical protein [Paraburkholderia sp. RL17-337-BIB-A]|uniref:hypothetical protein n=1 Tax=Paraburkholderia sp. RL17-337-BIB-A TaxID=3031636 RepID=UPI0038BAFF00